MILFFFQAFTAFVFGQWQDSWEAGLFMFLFLFTQGFINFLASARSEIKSRPIEAE